jgi:hypothetical protein
MDDTIGTGRAADVGDCTTETVRRYIKQYPALGYRFGPRNFRVRADAWARICAGVHPADL